MRDVAAFAFAKFYGWVFQRWFAPEGFIVESVQVLGQVSDPKEQSGLNMTCEDRLDMAVESLRLIQDQKGCEHFSCVTQEDIDQVAKVWTCGDENDFVLLRCILSDYVASILDS